MSLPPGGEAGAYPAVGCTHGYRDNAPCGAKIHPAVFEIRPLAGLVLK
jgi:hypothetical protein